MLSHALHVHAFQVCHCQVVRDVQVVVPLESLAILLQMASLRLHVILVYYVCLLSLILFTCCSITVLWVLVKWILYSCHIRFTQREQNHRGQQLSHLSLTIGSGLTDEDISGLAHRKEVFCSAEETLLWIEKQGGPCHCPSCIYFRRDPPRRRRKPRRKCLTVSLF